MLVDPAFQSDRDDTIAVLDRTRFLMILRPSLTRWCKGPPWASSDDMCRPGNGWTISRRF